MGRSWLQVVGVGYASVLRRSLPAGAAGGVGAIVLSVFLTALVLTVDGAFLDAFAAWKAVVLLVYGTHGVAVTVSSPAGARSIDLVGLAADSLSIPLVVYYLVPIAVLLASGFVVARRCVSQRRPVDGAVAGATLVVAYLPLAVVGAVLLTTTTGGQTAGPDLLASIVVAGVGYPVIFGGIGGALATVRD